MTRRGRDLADFDESDVRVRPGRRGSRPRTKQRPAHEDAVLGRVVAVDRGRYTLDVQGRHVIAMRARELGRKAVVVGDVVAVVGDIGGGPDALARIVRVEPRRSVLRRTADDSDPVERVIVANADQLAIVTALADPEPRPRMIDRCLVAAYDAGLETLLVLTKADLADPAPLVRAYGGLAGVRIVVTAQVGEPDTEVGLDGALADAPDGSLDGAAEPAGDAELDLEVEAGTGRSGEVDLMRGVTALADVLRGRTTVFVGHSGVGKSTLVNALVPGAARQTGHVNVVTGRGRHTSTSAIAVALPDDAGWIVDTPGVRSFGLAHVHPEDIVMHFSDLEPGTADCPRGCSHDEPECALDEWVAQGHAGSAGADRLESLRRLLRARTKD